jgi:indolepyruvate ferredoxin oxidoreductase
MRHADAALNDVFTKDSGQVFLRGVQALVRLPMVQVARDRKAGLNTAGFISGYRGSPLGGYDMALANAKPFLDEYGIVVKPAVNEELAASAVWGTQQLHLSPGAQKDGVFGIWYGKGPGVDRTGDVFKHGNAAGTAKHGGVLCLAGDDHAAKSSTVPHQSDHAFMSALIPVLYPSGAHEFVRMGLLGIAMSRFSGCWVAMKVISDTAESSATVDLAGENEPFIIPTDFEMPPGGLNLRWPDDRWSQDHRLQTYKGYAAIAFARANGVDRVVLNPERARYGIVASGKAFEESREALSLLGINPEIATTLGLRLLKIGMPWPLDPQGIRKFSEGLEEILVVEERREMIENQIKQHLFNWHSDVRPRIVGKFDEKDIPVLPLDHELSADMVAEVLAARLLRLPMPDDIRTRIIERAEILAARRKHLSQYAPPTVRRPHFCAGCPHNTSTVVPEGSRALAGIGCHFMVTWMDRRTETFTPMGGEGVPWMGVAPFTTEKHVFVNLGDGTYFHSGILAIRQAVASGANMTYKILFNDAVAMTGGQAVDGPLSLPRLTHQLHAEGVRQIYVVSDNPGRWRPAELAPGTELRHRDALERVMETLREEPGCTAIVYDQVCATELRRKRTRGKAPKAAEVAFINDAVCEGCGDCSVQSNCIAVEPLETEMGRKRQINQSLCNSDLSCLKGFCPSFVTVEGAKVRKSSGLALPSAPLPAPKSITLGTAPYNVAVTGIGGTGVLTVGHILGMAAHIEGFAAMVLDLSGLAQKGGAVISHVRFSRAADTITAPRIPLANTDLLLSADMVVSASHECLSLLSNHRTRAIIDTHVAPVAGFIQDRDFDFRASQILAQLKNEVRDPAALLDFHTLAVKAQGDSIAVNLMMLGYAYQEGLLPLSEEAIRRAIELNGVAVSFNIKAFMWGRYAAAMPDRVMAMLREERVSTLADMNLDDLIEHRAKHLAGYQNEALAQKYRDLVGRFRQREHDVSGKSTLTRAVAVNYANVLAYKDEYEVARLFTQGDFKRKLDQTFEGPLSIAFHLSPPLIAPFDKNLGRPRKLKFGAWILGVFKVLAGLKGLRGSLLDIFKWTAERRRERGLIATYETGLSALLLGLTEANHAAAVAVASAPSMVRGFGPVKMRAFEKFDHEWPQLLDRFKKGTSVPVESYAVAKAAVLERT